MFPMYPFSTPWKHQKTDGEDLWQWSLLEIRLNFFRQSAIPQKQFIVSSFIIIIIIIIIINHHLSSPSTLLIIIPLAAIAINNVGQLINSSVEYWKWNVWPYVFFVFLLLGFEILYLSPSRKIITNPEVYGAWSVLRK